MEQDWGRGVDGSETVSPRPAGPAARLGTKRITGFPEPQGGKGSDQD